VPNAQCPHPTSLLIYQSTPDCQARFFNITQPRNIINTNLPPCFCHCFISEYLTCVIPLANTIQKTTRLCIALGRFVDLPTCLLDEQSSSCMGENVNVWVEIFYSFYAHSHWIVYIDINTRCILSDYHAVITFLFCIKACHSLNIHCH